MTDAGAAPGGGAIVGLGANLGDRLANLRAAVARLGETAGRVRAASPVYETAPVGGPPQGEYLNAAVWLDTALAPGALLDALLGVERALGRVRRERDGPRTIDLDLLHVPGVTLEGPALTLPHPRLLDRAFALAPLLDVWPSAPAAWHARLAALGGPPHRRVAGPTWATF